MAGLVWDKIGERIYERGLDKGVLYLPDGTAVPWNGLTSIVEKFDKETTPIYYDGMKVNELVILGDFSAIMNAITYPDEFLDLEGFVSTRPGVFYGDQRPKPFGLCYRTKIGNDLDGDSLGYKIHIVYNITALPNDRSYASLTESPSLVEFEWSITAVPEEFPGFRPTAHIIIDSRTIDPWLLEEIEEILYGSDSSDASLMPMPELISYINDWYRLKITDNGDGTWTATEARPGFISINELEQSFVITNANASYLDGDTYVITDTRDISDNP
jgi:hypothetical protein